VGGTHSAPDYGATLFPFIQNFAGECLGCDMPNKTSCNNLDNEFMFYFDAAEPGVPTWFDYNRADFKHYSKSNQPTVADSGMSGLLRVELYYGVEFLTKGFYDLPDTHCTTPIALALSSSLTCGSHESGKMIKNGKQHGFYCASLPVSPQEVFFECRKGPFTVFFESAGTAYGTAATLTSLLTIALMLFVVNILLKNDVLKDSVLKDDVKDVGGEGVELSPIMWIEKHRV